MDTEGHLKVNILLQNEMPFLPRSAGTFYVWIDAKLKNQLVVVPPRLECPFPNNLLYFSFSSSLSLKQTKKRTQRIQFFIFPTTSLLLKNLWDIEVAGSAVYPPPHLFLSFSPLAFETFHKKTHPPCQICVPPFTAKGLLAPTRPFLVTAFEGALSPTTQDEAQWPCRCQLIDVSSSETWCRPVPSAEERCGPVELQNSSMPTTFKMTVKDVCVWPVANLMSASCCAGGGINQLYRGNGFVFGLLTAPRCSTGCGNTSSEVSKVLVKGAPWDSLLRCADAKG